MIDDIVTEAPGSITEEDKTKAAAVGSFALEMFWDIVPWAVPQVPYRFQSMNTVQ